jgi:3-deoxy-D-manno-octulosonic-acid transferase
MFFLYSLFYTLAFILMSPLLLLRREKYAAGFNERLGNYPEFKKDSRPVVWLHCVSVGETNAARPLVEQLLAAFPDHRLVFSTTTRTGQELARSIFKDKADAVFYFPFDWKFTVRRALRHFGPSVILMMETEIWPRFFLESHVSGAKIAIVNGRLSGKSFRRYSHVRSFVRRVLSFIDLALMQDEKDAERMGSLGVNANKITVSGNLKFDLSMDEKESDLTEVFRTRFGIDGTRPLIVAASTHEPEEEWVLNALDLSGYPFRLLFAPRHPERFDAVAKTLGETQYSLIRRSNYPTEADKNADVILLDSIGELRAVYPLADIVFVGGSLIPRGGQSVLEPASAGKPVVIGPFTHNFEAVVDGFLEKRAIVQAKSATSGHDEPFELYSALRVFFDEPDKRVEYGKRALEVMESNRGATEKTIESLRPLINR